MQNIPCKLTVDNKRNIVASGYIMNTDSTTIHVVAMPKEVAHVVIKVAIDETARLPFQNLNENIAEVG